MGIDQKLEQLEKTVKVQPKKQDSIQFETAELFDELESVKVSLNVSKLMEFLQRSVQLVSEKVLSAFIERTNQRIEKSQTDLIDKMATLQPKDEMRISNPHEFPIAKEVTVKNLKDLKLPTPRSIVNVEPPDLKGLEKGLETTIVKALGAEENWNTLHFNRTSSGLVTSLYIEYNNRIVLYEFKRNNRGLIDDIIRTIKPV